MDAKQKVAWRDEFERALDEHLRRGEEAGLLSAYDLGRRALGSGLGVLDVAGLAHEVLLAACAREQGEPPRAVEAAGHVLLECLSPFEMACRGVREANTALRGLNDLLEEQTRRISHELHDQAGQLLASVHLALDELARDLPSAAAARIDPIRDLLDSIEEQLRRLSHELRPTILDDLGLGPALEFLAEGVAGRSGLAITVERMPEARLPSRVETVLYRVVQEALNNVSKHARASAVTIVVEDQEGVVTCSIRDDGVGFDPSTVGRHDDAGGIGLIGIRERLARLGGSLEIRSNPRGTQLLVMIPQERCARAGAAIAGPSSEPAVPFAPGGRGGPP